MHRLFNRSAPYPVGSAVRRWLYGVALLALAVSATAAPTARSYRHDLLKKAEAAYLPGNYDSATTSLRNLGRGRLAGVGDAVLAAATAAPTRLVRGDRGWVWLSSEAGNTLTRTRDSAELSAAGEHLRGMVRTGTYTVSDERRVRPSGFGFDPGFNVFRDFTHDFDIDAQKPAIAVSYYVNSETGDDTTGDGSIVSPWRSLWKAWGEEDCDRIFAHGRFGYQTGAAGTEPTRSLVIEPYLGERVEISAAIEGIVWSHVSGNVWSTSTANIKSTVLDRTFTNEEGDMIRYATATSVATCQATPGSRWLNGATLYVHTHDSREPDEDVIGIRSSVSALRFSINATLWVRGVDFFAAGAPTVLFDQEATTARAYFADCFFGYSTTSNGLSVRSGGIAYLVDCRATGNYLDGFNYHKTSSNPPRSVEIGCYSYNNGWSGGEANNATTTHDGGSVIRLNGRYPSSVGRTIHDIGNCEVWMINCEVGPGGSDRDFGLSGTGSEAWLDSCTIDSRIVADSGTSIYLADTTGTGSGSGTIDSWSPIVGDEWTLAVGSSGLQSAIVDRDLLVFDGVDDYAATADHDNLDFASSTQPHAVAIALRDHNWPATSAWTWLAKKTTNSTSSGPGYAIIHGSAGNVAIRGVSDGSSGVGQSVVVAGREGADVLLSAFANGSISRVGFNGTNESTSSVVNRDMRNAEELRIGRLSGSGTGYAPMSYLGHAVLRRFLTPAQLARLRWEMNALETSRFGNR